jgi:hypothetical protein
VTYLTRLLISYTAPFDRDTTNRLPSGPVWMSVPTPKPAPNCRLSLSLSDVELAQVVGDAVRETRIVDRNLSPIGGIEPEQISI